MLPSVNKDDRLWFIKKQIGGVSRFVDIARDHCETFRLIIESVSREERLRLLWMDDCFRTLAVKHVETFRMLLQSVSSDEILQILQIKDWSGQTVLYRAACMPVTEGIDMLKMIMQSIRSDERLHLLQLEDDYGMTTLHHAACVSATNITEVILESVSEEERYVLLRTLDSCKYTPIQLACFHKPRSLDGTIRLITEETWYRALLVPDGRGYTPLHVSAYRGQTKVIKSVSNSLSAQHLSCLLRNTDRVGHTP